MSFFDNQILKCVGFIASKTVDGTFQLRGSVFFIGTADVPGEENLVGDLHWVTAKHVIEGIRRLGCESVFVRLNVMDGETRWVETKTSDWYSSKNNPASDIAILSHGFDETDDHVAIGPQFFLNEEIIDRLDLGVSDEVAVVGLFRHRAGRMRNIPIVRMGNVASFDHEDLINTQLGPAPIYLIEARSIGGLSGSPVFVGVGVRRSIFGKPKEGDKNFYLMGLIHGHYDVTEDAIDAFDAAGLSVEKVNTGIAMVTPFFRLTELIDEYKQHREALSRRRLFSIAPDTDSILLTGPLSHLASRPDKTD